MSNGSKKKPAVDEITLTWNLLDLPTAQHKAGLAGLVMAIRSIERRSINDPELILPLSVPKVINVTQKNVSILLTDQSLRQLMSDTYDVDLAETDPVEKKKLRNKGKVTVEPLRTISRTEIVTNAKGKTTTKLFEQYVYLRFRSRLPAIRNLFPAAQWIKLWQDFIHGAIRDNTKDGPFRDEAIRRAHGTEWEACALAQWGNFGTKDPSEVKDNEFLTIDRLHNSFNGSLEEPVSGSLWIGAQSKNTERVEFCGAPHLTFLLHFWHLSMMVFVPSIVDSKGKQFISKKSEKDKSQQYIVAIPEVSDLARFTETFPQIIAKLNPQTMMYRPSQAVIVLPEQASLEFIHSFSVLADIKSISVFARSVHAVDYFHLVRPDPTKAAVLASKGCVGNRQELLEAYHDIVRTDTPDQVRNPLFKAALIQALLRKKEWWEELLPLFNNRDWRFFINAFDTVSMAPDIAKLACFWIDTRNRLAIEQSRWLEKEKYKMENQPKLPRPLPLLINQVVRSYVWRRAQDRSGVDPSKFKAGDTDDARIDWKKVPESFDRARAEVSQSLFLEFRSRREQAFVAHFAQTFFATNPKLSDEDQQALANALIDGQRLDDIKTLTLLALSANS